MKNNILIIISILIILSISEPTYQHTYCIDRIEGNTIVLIREGDYMEIHLDRLGYPNLTEGDVIDCNYQIDVDATAELANRIAILQIELLQRGE